MFIFSKKIYPHSTFYFGIELSNHSHQNEEQISCSVLSLCCSSLFPEAVLLHTKVRSISAVQSFLCVASRCPRGSLVPLKIRSRSAVKPIICVAPRCSQRQFCPIQIEEHQFHPVHPAGPGASLYLTRTMEPHKIVI